MSVAKTILGIAGLGAAGYVGWRWLRRHDFDLRRSEHQARDYFEQALGDSIDHPQTSADQWAEWERPATEPGIRRDADGALTRRWDGLFASVYGAGLPVAYLRALAEGESGMDASNPKGMINVVSVALDDYNRRHGSAIRADEMRVPMINLKVAADTLRTIIASYARNHPDVPNLRENWQNSAFVELLTLGWTAGFSESTGVGKVIKYLKSKGQTDITADDVHRAAQAAGATQWLALEPMAGAKLRWSQTVARRYVAERLRDESERRRAVASANSIAPRRFEAGHG